MEIKSGVIKPVGLTDFSFREEEDEKIANIAPQFQSKVFIVMIPSDKSGATYSFIRKSRQSLNNFLRTLESLKFDMTQVSVIEQEKPWVPTRKKDLEDENKKNKARQLMDREVMHEVKPHLLKHKGKRF